jgi:hypothetical protein
VTIASHLHRSLNCLLAGFALLAAGCGGTGGGGGTSVPLTTVSGVAAAGQVIAGQVSLRDSSATPKELTRATSDGSYSFDVTGMTKPYLLKVSGTSGSTSYTLYSLAGDTGVANLNPLGNLVLARAAGSTDLAALWSGATAAALEGAAAGLTPALTEVQATLKPLLAKYGAAAQDPIRGSFQANHTGLDLLLDQVQITLAAGSVTITETGSQPVTRPLSTGFATRTLTGSVTLDWIPAAGVGISVTDPVSGIELASALSQADGSYRLANVPQGSVLVTPTLTGCRFDRAGSTLEVADGDLGVPVFRARSPFSISGTVASSNGRGLAGVTVSARRGDVLIVRAHTDGNGRYTLKGLSAGDYSVIPSRLDVFTSSSTPVTFDQASRSLTLSAQENSATADFAANLASYSITGTVAKLTGGEPLAQVAFTLVTKDLNGALLTSSDMIYSTTSDAQGNYTISGIPSGYYALTPVLSGYGFALPATFTSHGVTADNFLLNGADLRLDFTGRPASEATGGVGGI